MKTMKPFWSLLTTLSSYKMVLDKSVRFPFSGREKGDVPFPPAQPNKIWESLILPPGVIQVRSTPAARAELPPLRCALQRSAAAGSAGSVLEREWGATAAAKHQSFLWHHPTPPAACPKSLFCLKWPVPGKPGYCGIAREKRGAGQAPLAAACSLTALLPSGNSLPTPCPGWAAAPPPRWKLALCNESENTHPLCGKEETTVPVFSHIEPVRFVLLLKLDPEK